jgi:hypothetical protein
MLFKRNAWYEHFQNNQPYDDNKEIYVFFFLLFLYYISIVCVYQIKGPLTY